MQVSQKVEEKIKPMFENLNVRLVEVCYEKRMDGMHLVIYLDKDSGITLEDCQMVSKMIDPVVEELNPTNNAPYYLDVMSYGLDRSLKYDWQLDKYTDKKVVVKTYMKIDGVKDFEIILKSYDNDSITFEKDNNTFVIERNKIATITPYIEF